MIGVCVLGCSNIRVAQQLVNRQYAYCTTPGQGNEGRAGIWQGMSRGIAITRKVICGVVQEGRFPGLIGRSVPRYGTSRYWFAVWAPVRLSASLMRSESYTCITMDMNDGSRPSADCQIGRGAVVTNLSMVDEDEVYYGVSSLDLVF